MANLGIRGKALKLNLIVNFSGFQKLKEGSRTQNLIGNLITRLLLEPPSL
jgi:hypothetical protein